MQVEMNGFDCRLPLSKHALYLLFTAHPDASPDMVEMSELLGPGKRDPWQTWGQLHLRAS